MTNTRTTAALLLAALLLAAGLLAAACTGGGDGGSDDVASIDGSDAGSGDEAAADEDPEAELMEWVECMRDEGIAMEDPVRDGDGNVTLDGPGIHIGGGGSGGGSGGERPDPADDELPDPDAMDAAMEACGGMPPIVGDDPGEVDEEQMQQDMLAFAECMRDEGVEDFPDPDFSDSGPGGRLQEDEDDGGPADGDGRDERVVIGPFGEIDLDDPTTKAAFEACESELGGPAEDRDGPTSGGEA